MKTCKNARNCEYGNCYKPNQCAYRTNMSEYDPCPKIFQNWENMIDKICGKEVSQDIQKEIITNTR